MLVSLLEFFPFNILVGKGLYHPHAQEAVLYLGIEFANLHPGTLEFHPHFPVEIHRAHQHQGQDCENNQGQPQVHGAQNAERSHDFHPGNKELLRAVVGKFRHVKEVAGNPGHNLPDFGVVIIGEGELLQMVKEVPAHIRFNPGAHHMANRRHIVVGRAVNEAQDQVKQPQLQNNLHSQGFQVIHAHIRDILDNQRQHQLADGGQRGAEKIQYQYPFVLFKIGGKPADQAPVAASFFHNNASSFPVLNHFYRYKTGPLALHDTTAP